MGVCGRKKTSVLKELGDPVTAGAPKLQEKARCDGVRVLPIIPPKEQIIKPAAMSINQGSERELDKQLA